MNVLIVGGGQVGSYLASLLLNNGHHVKVVEMREKQLHALERALPADSIVFGNFTDPIVLENAGIHKSDVVVALTPTDEANLVVSTLARYEFGVKRVIARANNPKNSWLFTPEMGVDVGLTEADLMAHVVAEEMSLGDMMIMHKLRRGQYSLVEEKVHPASSVSGKALSDLHLPAECVLVAVIRNNELCIPRGNTVLMAGDEVLAVSHVSQLNTLAKILGPVE
ncbi:MAG: TrkA family potassium uptake protein [Clostridiales bacterium]|nr:TrkA family potassium uptake protein [Clostridiales bacterium]